MKAYRYILLKGNNHPIVQKVLDVRPYWQKIPSKSTLFDFKWTPWSSGVHFEFLGKHGEKNLVNHFEGHHHITQKDKVFTNMLKVAEASQKDIFDSLPLSFVFDSTDHRHLDL